jgi:glycosyltransferase involved in cell wall biosynthesis
MAAVGELEPTAGGQSVETVSVIVCAHTLDRWDDLRAAMASVRAQTRPATEVIVVVDNNEVLLRRAQAELEGVMVTANVHPGGLSGGRLTGAELARGSVLAFLDDDAIADPIWLEELMAAYADPMALGAGGFVEPRWVTPRPGWFPAEFNWVVGCTYEGLPIDAGRIRNPIGANMSVRAEVMARAGTFDPVFGRSYSGTLARAGTCDETEFCIRASRLHPGGFWAYRHDARVRHTVTGQRATWRYFVNRCRMEAQSKALLTGLTGTDAGLASERTYVRSVLPRAVARELRGGLRGDVDALRRAGAIVAGLLITAAEYSRVRATGAWAARRGRDR